MQKLYHRELHRVDRDPKVPQYSRRLHVLKNRSKGRICRYPLVRSLLKWVKAASVVQSTSSSNRNFVEISRLQGTHDACVQSRQSGVRMGPRVYINWIFCGLKSSSASESLRAYCIGEICIGSPFCSIQIRRKLSKCFVVYNALGSTEKTNIFVGDVGKVCKTMWMHFLIHINIKKKKTVVEKLAWS